MKMSISVEPYLDCIKNRKMRYELASFRVGSHGLEIDVGRRTTQLRHERVCKVCDANVVEDELHFMFFCKAYEDLRRQCLPKKYIVHPSYLKFNALLSNQCVETNVSVAKFIFLAKRKRTSLLEGILAH